MSLVGCIGMKCCKYLVYWALEHSWASKNNSGWIRLITPGTNQPTVAIKNDRKLRASKELST